MRQLVISVLLAGSFIALSTMDASAIVCARGVYRAGCVGAGGAVVVGRPVVRHPVLSSHDGTLLFTAGCTDNSLDVSARDIPRRRCGAERSWPES